MFEGTRSVVRAFNRLGLTATILVMAPAIRASDISFVDIFGNIGYQQTDNGNSLANAGDFFSADLNAKVPNPYSSASLAYPGAGSPQSLTQISPEDYHFQSGSFATLADMEAAYPFGTYSFSGTNGGGTQTARLNYTADDYAQSNPYLIGTDYTQLQGMDSSQGFTFHFSPFVTGPDATESFIFFTIFDETTNTLVVNDGFLSPATASEFVAGGTFTPGHLYDYELDYSNRDLFACPDFCGAQLTPVLGFEVRSDGLFSTAGPATVPEPQSYAMVLAIGLGFLLTRRRRPI